MKSLKDISAEGILRDDYVTGELDDSLSSIKAKMEKHNLREMPVMDDGNMAGMVSYRALIDHIHTDPSEAKVDNVIHTPPEANPQMNLIDLAVLRRDSGQKRFVLFEGDRLKGVIGEEEIVYALTSSVQELHNFTVKDLMNTEVITLNEDDTHDKAFKLMREESISRIPIVDNSGKVTGIISTVDALRIMHPRDQMNKHDYKGYKNEYSDIPCSELMQTTLPTITDTDLSLSKAIKKMKKLNARELIVIDGKERPKAIITLRDIIDFISTFEESDQVLVNLIGVDNQGEKERLHSKVETALRGRLSRIVDNIRELNIHVKTYETEGSRQKYSVHARMFSVLGITIAEKSDWKLLETMDRVIDSLAEQSRKEKEKRRDRIREQWRKGKYNR